MLFVKFYSLLTLLIAAPVLLVSGENSIGCYGDIQRLQCDTGLILVKSSVYGRTDSHTCNVNRPASQVANTNCAMRISTVADRCNGLRECELKTDLLGNSDPCYGTYKYYNTTYDCIDGRLSVTCEFCSSTLDCGEGTIQIINANYGRANTRTCSHGVPSSLTQDTNCYAPHTFTNVAARCNGQRRCIVQALFTLFTDPCYGTLKYLTVSYTCIPPTREIVTCEDNNAELSCGVQNIKIISANYGRTDSTTCTTEQPAGHVSKANCYMSDTLKIVKARCEGKSSCVVPATNNVFSDPCPYTSKFLKVVYSCV
ncbi:rhamnose-binding lectin-like isoform 2-T2 [Clarias gariepinus]|uniref:rhamnose-binding lectin-like isoform X2 n=1 Tax=Clarias gariepinus TaxID=13013 RepID=UPI00234C74A4|nr:rhamnose-binding lectin-like isoform X2 [Clarias gariepinus]